MSRTTAVNVTRTHPTHPPYTKTGLPFATAQNLVAWCAVDNLNWSHKAASDTASRLKIGEPLACGEYTFLAVRA